MFNNWDEMRYFIVGIKILSGWSQTAINPTKIIGIIKAGTGLNRAQTEISSPYHTELFEFKVDPFLKYVHTCSVRFRLGYVKLG